ncbi:MAG: DUF4369 domain-containing protein [Prevotella sp.]|nr:DUF4369 domain-containing protein [Prevotella sp.]
MNYKLLPFLLLLLLTACGTDSGHFRIDGRFRHLNQGEFYVYSPDGIIEGFDTIKIQDGKFTYETSCPRKGTLVLLFPNFSEQPVFAEPGKTVKVKADASHLKELVAEGTKENKLMNGLREQMASASPPDIKKIAEQFVRDNPSSLASIYVTYRYFIQDANPDYRMASQLAALMNKEQEKTPFLAKITAAANAMKQTAGGGNLPTFKTKDINGNTVTSADFGKSTVGVITLWATWNEHSCTVNRNLIPLYKKANGKLKVVSVCVDAETANCRRYMERDSLKWPVVCDGQMFDSPLVRQLGLGNVPDNIVIHNGRVVSHGLSTPKLIEKVESLL